MRFSVTAALVKKEILDPCEAHSRLRFTLLVLVSLDPSINARAVASAEYGTE